MASVLTGRIALITGAASGLGKATAMRFARAGARVAIVDLPSQPGSAVAKAIGANAHFMPADVTKESDIKSVLDEIESKFGGSVNTVVQCAGIAIATKMMSSKGVHSLEAFTKVRFKRRALQL